MHPLLSALILLAQVSPPAPMVPIPMVREMHHHVVLENATVKVLSVRLPAGEVMDLHAHPVDHLAVVIESAKLRNEVEGQAPVEHYTGDPGAVIFLPAGPPHLQANIDTHAAWWVGVELVGLPGPVAPSVRVGPHYQSMLDNPRVQAAKLVLAPGERVDRFPFPPPFLQIPITPGDLEVTREHGAMVRATLYAGAPTWESERIRTFVNRGGHPLQLVFVRVK